MTPRIVVTAFKQDVSVEQALATAGKGLFSRLPIYRDSLDHVTGVGFR